MKKRFTTIILSMVAISIFAQPGVLSEIEERILTTASGQEINAEFGTLSLPENRDAPSSAIISLPFVRLKSTAKKPVSPIIYLEGGPGASSTWVADNPHALEGWAPQLAFGDIIFYDQRGTGAASRRLTWINMFPLPEDVLVTEAVATKHFTGMVPKAKAAWLAGGIDYRGYTTMESAKDIDALRQALGLEKVSIIGFSYGTHLGQAYMKYFGAYVDKAILAGVEGLGENFKLPLRIDAQFHKLSAMVAADEAVNADVPDLVELYQKVSKKLTKDPISLKLRNPITDKNITMKIGKLGLDFILFRDLGDASDLPVIPRLLYTIDQGDYSIFHWFLQKRFSGLFGLHAMSITTDLASGASPERLAIIESQRKQSMFGNILNTPFLALLDVWDAPDLGTEYRNDFTSTIPTLLLSGTLDLNTPPYQAERLRWGLPNAHHIIVQNAGHEQILTHPSVVAAIGKFLMGEDISDVTASWPPLKFIPVVGEREGVGHPSIR